MDARTLSRPWGVHRVGDIYAPGVSSGTPDGTYARAVAMPYSGNRIRAAWWVLTGRAYAFLWPEAGDLEAALGLELQRRGGREQAVSPEAIEQNLKRWVAWKRQAERLATALQECTGAIWELYPWESRAEFESDPAVSAAREAIADWARAAVKP